jgi:hypothetical protein
MWIILVIVWLSVAFQPLSAQPIIPGAPISGQLTPDNLIAVYTFEGRANDVISVGAGAADAPFNSLVLSSPDGTELRRVTPGDYPFPLNTGWVQLPQNGFYTVTITGSQPTAYEILLSRRQTPVIDYSVAAQEYFFDRVDEVDFHFHGEAGQNIVLSVTSEYFAPLLAVYAPDGALIAQDNDPYTGSRLHAETPLTLPQTGEYRLVVTRDFDTGVGPFYLSIYPVDESVVRYGEQYEVTLEPGTAEKTFYWWGSAGDLIEFQAGVLEGRADIRLEDPVSNTDLALLQGQSGTVPNIILPHDSQPYRVVVRSLYLTEPSRAYFSLTRRDQNVVKDRGTLRAFLNARQTAHTVHFDSPTAATVSLTVSQGQLSYSGEPYNVVPFIVTVTQSGENITVYTFGGAGRMQAVETTVTVPVQPGRVHVRLELLSPEAGMPPAVFTLSPYFNFGIG